MRIRVIDSHTGGEPTRVCLDPLPGMPTGSLAQKAEFLAEHHSTWGRGLIVEPRGSEIVVGALLTDPENEGSECGVIFFNNAGLLGMCGHGLIGVMETLRFLGRIGPGVCQIDTLVGTVRAEMSPDHQVSFVNVPSYVHQDPITVSVPGYGEYSGGIAFGGNWFFLVDGQRQDLSIANVDALMRETEAIMAALAHQRITGKGGAAIDHVELFGPSEAGHDSKNFVLCPGMQFDRSPCGTGTSAKMAWLAHRGLLAPTTRYRQESITGSVFEASYELCDQGVLPRIWGRAHVVAESELIFESDDPLQWGIPQV